MTPEELDSLIARFLAADRRERHVLLKEITPHLETEHVVRIAPVLRDPSPKTSARVVSLMARHDLAELLEELLVGLKPGKVELLRRQFARTRASTRGTNE